MLWFIPDRVCGEYHRKVFLPDHPIPFAGMCCMERIKEGKAPASKRAPLDIKSTEQERDRHKSEEMAQGLSSFVPAVLFHQR